MGVPKGIFVSLQVIFCIILPWITRTLRVILGQVKTNSTVAQNNNFSLKQPRTLYLCVVVAVVVHLPTPARMLLSLP